METITFEEWALLSLVAVSVAMVIGGALGYVVEKWKRNNRGRY